MSGPALSNNWSDDLKAQTRGVIEGRDILAARGGQLCLKHATSGFGTIAAYSDGSQSGIPTQTSR